MTATARLIRHDDVGVIELDNPPVNALALGLRAGLSAALDAALADPSIVAIVLAGAGRMFCGGADLREFNTPAAAQPPATTDLRGRMERAPKPVVAAIHGSALGGGLEMALACHYRVASTGTKLGLPEVQRGLLPGGGGTQRLPRLVGVATALEMIVGGEPVDAARARAIGLVDEVVDGDVRAAAVAFARRKAAAGGSHPVASTRTASIDEPEVFFKAARERVARESRGLEAPLECVACVEAATRLPFEEGIAFERARFRVLVEGNQSKALRHLFFAERAAARIPGIPEDLPTRPIRRVGVIGAGTMGGGIAMSLANAGLEVVQLETAREALDKGRTTMSRNWGASVEKGKLTKDEMDARLSRVRGTLSYDDLADVDLVIEAVFEDMAVKKQVFATLDAVCRPGAILASNTSRLDIDEIARATKRPQDVIGLHYFSPANVMRLLEVVRGAASAPDVIATSMAFGRATGKLPVLVGNCEGFVGNRMLSAYVREAGFLLEEGASPAQVDGALQRFGLAMGPFRMGDLAGLDIGWAGRKRAAATRPKHLRYSKVADRICELGRFGQKTGAGWYRYEAGSRTPVSDPLVEQIVRQCADEAGIVRRTVADQEIVERTMYALVNEGAKILAEGIALRASDVDLVYVNGYGFPAWRGGPMFFADTIGLREVADKVRELHAKHGGWWTPAPRLLELAAAERRFNQGE
ncbi:MAG: 3-hydroxyacyl-CoA dehydrogenase NAD-binding domain-containing protein [Burkholderiales bacterium]